MRSSREIAKAFAAKRIKNTVWKNMLLIVVLLYLRTAIAIIQCRKKIYFSIP
jgi:hypothetical protein